MGAAGGCEGFATEPPAKVKLLWAVRLATTRFGTCVPAAGTTAPPFAPTIVHAIGYDPTAGATAYLKLTKSLPPGGSEFASATAAHGVEVCVAATGAVETAHRSMSH